MNYFSNFDLTYFSKIIFFLLSSTFAIIIGFSLVLYPLPSFLIGGLLGLVISRKYIAEKEGEYITLAQPHIKKFIDYFFNISAQNLEDIKGISKKIPSLQKTLKEDGISLKKDTVINLVFEELILSFINGHLPSSFRIKVTKEEDYDNEIKALLYILDKMDIKISRDKARNSIVTILKAEKRRNFFNYFLNKNPNLKEESSILNLARAYVDTFEDDLSYRICT